MIDSSLAGEPETSGLSRFMLFAAVAAIAAITMGVLLMAMPGSASAADRTVRLTLQPSSAACTAYDQLDCSYLEARDGNAPAPDPETGPDPTFLNMALLPSLPTVDATISDTGDVTIPASKVSFPEFPTSLENALVGTVAIKIQISASDDWSGTFDEVSGDMSLEAPIGLSFKLNCDPVANGTCGAIFGAQGNMGTWEVSPKGPISPLTTGHLDAPTPPLDYGPEWLGPDAEDGTPFDAETGVGTLVNNDLEIENLDDTSCVDMTSVACSNAAVANLIAPSLNGALGTVYDPAEPDNDRDSAPGAIDMRFTFAMSEPPLITSAPTAVTMTGMNGDGSQAIGTSSAAQGVTISASDIGDVEFKRIYLNGGNDDDFYVSNASDCLPAVGAGADCVVKLRFNPSATGARSSTLYASIVNPVSGDSETVQLATVSGTGGDLPTGPAGADGQPGAPGPQGPQGPRGNAGPLVAIASSSSIKLKAKANRVASIRSAGAKVTLKTPKSTRIKVRGKSFKLKVTAPKSIAAGKTGAVKVKGKKAAVKRLRGKRSAKLKIKLKVSANGRTQTHTVKVRVN